MIQKQTDSPKFWRELGAKCLIYITFIATLAGLHHFSRYSERAKVKIPCSRSCQWRKKDDLDVRGLVMLSRKLKPHLGLAEAANSRAEHGRSCVMLRWEHPSLMLAPALTNRIKMRWKWGMACPKADSQPLRGASVESPGGDARWPNSLAACTYAGPFPRFSLITQWGRAEWRVKTPACCLIFPHRYSASC